MNKEESNLDLYVIFMFLVVGFIMASYYLLEVREKIGNDVVAEMGRTHNCEKTKTGHKCTPKMSLNGASYE